MHAFAQFKQWCRQYYLLVLSAFLLGIPFVHYNLGWLSLISLLPLLYWLNQQDCRHKRQIILPIWLMGVGVFTLVLSWFLWTNPDRWAVLSGLQAILLLICLFLIFVFGLSLQYVLLGFLFYRIKPKLLSWPSIIILPALWIVSEYARSVLFSVFMAGPGASIGPYWNFGVLGFGASVTPILFSARFVGLYGLSAIVIVINIAIFWLLHKRYIVPILVMMSVLTITFFGYYIYHRSSNKQVFGGYTQLFRTELDELDPAFSSYHKELEPSMQKAEVLTNTIHILVLPEYSEIFNPENKSIDKDFTKKYLTQDGVIITSISQKHDKHSTNNVIVYNKEGDVITDHRKTFLIPVGEYMPYFIKGLLLLAQQKQALDLTDSMQLVDQGNQKEPIIEINGWRIGALACSGAIAPELYRDMAKQGAQLLTNSAAIGTFGNAVMYHQQTRQMARFEAVANAKPFIQASEGGYSYIVDKNGRFILRTTQRGMAVGISDIELSDTTTFYSYVGEWVVCLSFVLVMALVVKSYASD